MQYFTESQSYVDRLRVEHEELHDQIRRVERELADASAVGDSRRSSECLSKLREALRRHFRREEEGGYLEEAASRCPTLSREVAAIEREHPALLELLDRLIEPVGEAADVAASFRRFTQTLRDHEAAENRVLNYAFGTGEVVDEPTS